MDTPSITLDEILAADLPALCRQRRVRRLDLFGSAVGDRYDPARSDLDFLVSFEEIPAGFRAEAYFGLLADLEGLFGHAIDLVDERTLENPYLRRQIEAERRQLFPAAQ